ncbi:MAG: DUF2314 domain-containing protein [bacterium]|nr:DUF2314 domain-containing protein [bacterium]
MHELVIGIPGPWEDRNDVIRAVVGANPPEESPRFLAMGGLMMDMSTNTSIGLEVYEHDSGLAQAFEYAGQGRFSAEELKTITEHKQTVYLVCSDPPTSPSKDCLDAARKFLELGVLMLEAGGFAIKVESTGVAHTADRWRYYADQANILSLYDAFVTMVGGDEFNYTCGMHTFGLPDVSVTTGVPIDEAPYVMNGFNQYQLLESPELSDGTLFATSHIDPRLTMSLCAFGYDKDDILNNPFGRWHLELSDEAPAKNTTKFHTGSEPLFMALRGDDPKLLEAVANARSTLSRFKSHFRSPYEYGRYLVKIHVRDGDESAYIWAVLTDVSSDSLTVQLFEMPPEFVNYRAGQNLALRDDEVYDWCINRNGTLIGGFSRRLQRELIPSEERPQFDLFSGAIAFAPIDELL